MKIYKARLRKKNKNCVFLENKKGSHWRLELQATFPSSLGHAMVRLRTFLEVSDTFHVF